MQFLIKLFGCSFFVIALGVVAWKTAGFILDAMHGLPDDHTAMDQEEEL